MTTFIIASIFAFFAVSGAVAFSLTERGAPCAVQSSSCYHKQRLNDRVVFVSRYSQPALCSEDKLSGKTCDHNQPSSTSSMQL